MEERDIPIRGLRGNPAVARLPIFKDGNFAGTSPVFWILVAPPVLLYLGLLTMTHGAWILAPVLFVTLCFIAVLQPTLDVYLLGILGLVCWFPEFSQSEFEIYSADEFASLYNFRPIPTITASVFDYLFAGILVGWIVRMSRERRKLWKLPLAKPMMFFLAIWALNLVYGLARHNDGYYALREFRVGAYFVLAYFMVVTACGNLHTITKFLKLAAVMAALVGAYGIVRYALGLGQELDGAHIVYYDLADSVVLYTTMLLVVSFALEGVVVRSHRILASTLMFLATFSFLFSYRRGAWVGFAVGLLFLLFAYSDGARLRSRIILRFLVPAALVGALIVAIPSVRNGGLEYISNRFSSIFDVTSNASDAFRVLDAVNALNTFVKHPIFGVGAGGRYDLEFTSQSQEINDFMDRVSNASHNGFIFILFKSGILGFCAYCAVLIAFFRLWLKGREAARHGLNHALWKALGAIVVTMLVNNLFDPISDTLRSSLILAVVMGCGAAWITHLTERPEDQFDEAFGGS